MARRWLHLGVFFAGMVLSCLCAHRALAASPSTALAQSQTDLLDRLQDLVSRLRTQRQDYYRRKARDDAKIQETRENARLLQTQVTELRQQEADLEAEIRKYQAELQTLAAQTAQRDLVRRAIASTMATFAVRQEDEIRRGIPYRQSERIARLHAGSADANDVASHAAAEPFGHLWSYAQEELRLAGSSETYSDRAAVEGDLRPYARYFRVGQLMLGYVTEDGCWTALWLPKVSGGTWQSVLDSGQAAQVRDAVEILDRRQAPGFVSLPISAGPLPADRKAP